MPSPILPRGRCPFFSIPKQATFDSGSINTYCTYTGQPTENDDHPINCLTWTKAREYCTTAGKVLPSEAQFEYAASGLRSATFVWGEDAPSCADAIFARNATPSSPLTCRTDPSAARKPSATGSGVRDRLVIDGQTIFDLAGNVREWTRDVFDVQTGACWNAPLLFDPVCASGPDSKERSVRGGGWNDEPAFLRAASRHHGPAHDVLAYYMDDYPGLEGGGVIGFRCARPDD